MATPLSFLEVMTRRVEEEEGVDSPVAASMRQQLALLRKVGGRAAYGLQYDRDAAPPEPPEPPEPPAPENPDEPGEPGTQE